MMRFAVDETIKAMRVCKDDLIKFTFEHCGRVIKQYNYHAHQDMTIDRFKVEWFEDDEGMEYGFKIVVGKSK